MKKRANYTEKAKYYYSCKCGEKGTTIFEYGEVLQPTEDLEYILSSDGTYYIVNRGFATDKDIVLATEVNGIPVKSIGTFSFRNCSGLESITIPDSVTSIGDFAFSGCSGLTSVTIGNGVTKIGSNAFSDCSGIIQKENGVQYVDKWVIGCDTSVTEVELRSNTKGIANGAFKNCGGLTSITIPDSVTSIGSGAFNYCIGLTSITIPDSVTNIDGVAFEGCNGLQYNEYDNGLYLGNEQNNYFVLVKAKNKDITSCTINENTKVVCAYAFRDCSGLTSITIPDSVTSIGQNVFLRCGELTSINVGVNNKVYISAGNCLLTKDGKKLVFGCKTSIIPYGVTSIGGGAFQGCIGLTSITIPDSVTSIGIYTFSGCSGLTSVTIGNGVTKIDSDAFRGCSGLTSITIPDSVTSIGVFTFSDCSGLKNIIFNGTIKQWNAIKKGTYWISGTDDYTIQCTDGKLDKDGNEIE